MQLIEDTGKKYYAGNVDLFRLYEKSEAFREAVGSGKYVYLDERLCLVTPESVDVRENDIILSDAARANPSAFLMGFSDAVSRHDDELLQHKKCKKPNLLQQAYNKVKMLFALRQLRHMRAHSYKNRRYSKGRAYRIDRRRLYKKSYKRRIKARPIQIEIGDTVQSILNEREEGKIRDKDWFDEQASTAAFPIQHENEPAKRKEDVYPASREITVDDNMTASFRNFCGSFQESNDTFGNTLKKFMKKNHITVDSLANELGISSRQLRRLRNGDMKPTFEMLVALCIGMHLEPWNSEVLFRSAWRRFPSTGEGKIYVFLLRCCYTRSIAECNRFLFFNGEDTLTDKLFEDR